MTSATPEEMGQAGGMLFRHLAGSAEFAEFALILKRLTGLSMALNTPDVATICIGVTGDTGNPLCEMIRGTPEGLRRCEACDRRQHARAGSDREAKLYRCHAGFYDMAIPILIQDKHVATISSGQVLQERPSDAGFARLRRRLRWLGVPEAQMRRAYDQASWMPRDQLRHVMRLLEIFARQMCDSAWRIRELEAARERPDIRRAKDLVEERFAERRLQLATVATHAGLSPAYFSHLFHQETGMTFTKYLQSRRIAEAQRLLASTGKSITEICFACGFSSLTHFNRVFRAFAGQSPRQHRGAGGGTE